MKFLAVLFLLACFLPLIECQYEAWVFTFTVTGSNGTISSPFLEDANVAYPLKVGSQVFNSGRSARLVAPLTTWLAPGTRVRIGYVLTSTNGLIISRVKWVSSPPGFVSSFPSTQLAGSVTQTSGNSPSTYRAIETFSTGETVTVDVSLASFGTCSAA